MFDFDALAIEMDKAQTASMNALTIWANAQKAAVDGYVFFMQQSMTYARENLDKTSGKTK